MWVISKQMQSRQFSLCLARFLRQQQCSTFLKCMLCLGLYVAIQSFIYRNDLQKLNLKTITMTCHCHWNFFVDIKMFEWHSRGYYQTFFFFARMVRTKMGYRILDVNSERGPFGYVFCNICALWKDFMIKGRNCGKIVQFIVYFFKG